MFGERLHFISLAMQALKDSLKYQQWHSALQESGIDLRSVEELHTVRKRDGQVLFSMIRIDAVSPEQQPLLPIALLRGHFVGVLMSLINSETGEEKFLMVRQRRVGNGAHSLEHPAGMVDNTKDPFEVALTEVWEETSIRITRQQLVLLNDKVLYSSPGLMDEGGYFFATQITLSPTEIEALNEIEQGHGGEGEFIHTVVISKEEAMTQSTVANALLHFYLWEDWKRKQG